MQKSRANISLSNLAEVNESGIFLAVKKGLNEIFRRKHRSASLPPPKKPVNRYERLLSVIICTANRHSLAQNAVNSITSQEFPRDLLEIVVVNNSPKPCPRELFPASVVLTDEPRLGLSLARNKGASVARGEYLLFIDDDAVACDGLLRAIIDAFETHPKTAIIGGQIKLKLPDPTPSVFMPGREALWSGYTVPYKSFREIREHYEFPYGACFAVRHSALDAMGGFPVSYGRRGNDFAGGEETALCFTAKNMGMKIGIEPMAQVWHCVSADRFTKEHIRKTILAGILTTHRLFLDGYTPNGWTLSYIKERKHIILSEIKKLREKGNSLAVFYKECELDAFSELGNRYFKE